KLPADKRQQGDRFSLISAILPAAIWIVRLSITDSSAAVSAGLRVAAACRQLSDDEWGDQLLWRTAAELFELSSVERTNAEQILAHVRAIEGQDEGTAALRVIGHMLATWHATPEEGIHYQLACIDLLLQWFGAKESVHRLILVSYFESYWRNAIQQCRFAFRSPDLIVAAIEAAMTAPVAKRDQAILSAAARGFRYRGLQEVLPGVHE